MTQEVAGQAGRLCCRKFKSSSETLSQSINQFNLKSVWDLAQIHQTV